MLEVTPTLTIAEEELEEQFLRAAGPGGQNVNKVASAVQLRFDVRHSPALSSEVRERLERLAGKRLTMEGVLIIKARRFRTQTQNREDARQRLATLIRQALVIPSKRKPTRASRAARQRRLEAKRHRGTVKRLRRSSSETND